jgi:hypothetical protein
MTHASGDAPAMILVNGRVHTMDDDRSRADAVAIGDGRIVAVGDAEEVRARAARAARVVDLAGATVIPGLIDAHNHLLSTGLMLTQIQLYDCRSIGEIVARVAARVAETAAGRWIVGRGWDESLLAERRHPTRADLDAVAPNHPVVLHRVWNKLVCNSAALRAAGITAATPDPPADVAYAGGFERDGAGEPTGLFGRRPLELNQGPMGPGCQRSAVRFAVASAGARTRSAAGPPERPAEALSGTRAQPRVSSAAPLLRALRD